jgi:hypothetical protein
VLTFKASQILKQALNAKEREKNGGSAHAPSASSGNNGGGGGTSSLSAGASGGMNVPLAAAASEAPKE